MYKSLVMVLVAGSVASSAYAEPKVELVGACRAKVEEELDLTNEDDTGCVKGAFVESVDDINGDVFSISYGRSVCEGYINGSADVTLTITKQRKSKGVTKITECKVRQLEITEESGD